jgi:hypothetical protein
MASKSDAPPKLFGRWQLVIGKAQYRIRLPDEAAKLIPWLKWEAGFSLDAQGFLGAQGQVQIASSVPGTEIIDRLNSQMVAAAFDPRGSPTQLAQLIRFSATTWPLRFSFELAADRPAGRFTLYLRREMADQHILPENQQELTMFIAGSLVELWKPADWLANIQATREYLERVIGAAANEIDELL